MNTAKESFHVDMPASYRKLENEGKRKNAKSNLLDQLGVEIKKPTMGYSLTLDPDFIDEGLVTLNGSHPKAKEIIESVGMRIFYLLRAKFREKDLKAKPEWRKRFVADIAAQFNEKLPLKPKIQSAMRADDIPEVTMRIPKANSSTFEIKAYYPEIIDYVRKKLTDANITVLDS